MKMRTAMVTAVVLTSVYLFALTSFLPRDHLKMISGLTISEYSFISSGNLAWSDETFSTGWTVNLTTSPNLNDSGFVTNGSVGYLYYNFTGGAVEEVEIQKKVSIDTSIYKYLTLRFNATTDDRSICFSSAVITEKGTWIGLPWNHVSRIEQVLVFDISTLYSGGITAIRFRITNDYNKNYNGEVQGVFIKFASISSSPPILATSSNNAVYTQLLPSGQYIEVKGSSPPANQSTNKVSIVSAVYSSPMKIDLSLFHYLNVTVKTDSPEMNARVIVWSEDGVSHTVLMTNYDETRWHQVIIDLTPFGITGNSINKIELGFTINVGSEAKTHSVYYGQISFDTVG